MKIGLDARKLRDGGIGTYIASLLRLYAKDAHGHRIVAFAQAQDVGAIAASETVQVVRADSAKYSFAEHWTLPYRARAAGVALFHAPHYTLPLGWSGPAVVTIHDLIHIRFARFFAPGAGVYARAMAGAAARRARLVLADSAATRDDVVRLLGVREAKVRVVHLGVARGIARRPASEVEAFRRARRLPGGYALYVGARKRHKNLSLVLEALARMPKRARPPFVLAGESWLPDDPLARLALKLGLGSGVQFSGELSGEAELSLLYSGAALYLQPSLAEGFGLPPLEAMACGVPVIAANTTSLPEVLGDAALLLPPDQPEAWAAEIGGLLVDNARMQDLARRGVERAARFTWEKTAAATLDAYVGAMSG